MTTDSNTTSMTATSSVQNGHMTMWYWLGAAAALVILWACRGAPLGSPVLDDYVFLHYLKFHRPFSWLDAMGAHWYWRPAGRQLYFLTIGRFASAAPWVIVLGHLAILAALYTTVFRIVMRRLSPLASAAMASFPLLGEPTRVLIGWPSGAQYLLAALGIALALRGVLENRRRLIAGGCALALCSHEVSLFALSLLPLIAPRGTKRASAVLIGAICVAWGIGLIWVVHAGHVQFQSGSAGVGAIHEIPRVLLLVIRAQLGLEDQGTTIRSALTVAYGALLVAACVALTRAPAQESLLKRIRLIGVGVFAFCVLSVPLIVLQPGWNEWRSMLPGVALGAALVGTFDAVGPALVGTFVLVRLVALLFAPSAPRVVTAEPPVSASAFSFPAMVRLQLLSNSTRNALRARGSRLPQGSTVRYWGMPHLSEWTFQGSNALQVWFHDSTLVWEPFRGVQGLRRASAAIVAYNADNASPAVVIEPEAYKAFLTAFGMLNNGRLVTGDSLLVRALQLQASPSVPFEIAVVRNRAELALALGMLARADSLSRRLLVLEGRRADVYVLAARIAIAAHRLDVAANALTAALSLDPSNLAAMELAHRL